ncbi:uncharacterized protein LOC121260118 [Juglans microcarpa x Juglans regia]|uniref:uncharacterized protein LOC121260118 n=1 Tax=Juglans microcarpa x Juglans regia TaxID=2249226 RepID=UPI001B7EF844|nr:uncharacterized protein LOC121260118 [Juglans microcarpa x Juglans regia]
MSFVHIWDGLVSRHNKTELELIVCALRTIWLQRNRLVFEGKLKGPKKVWLIARLEVKDFHQQCGMTQIVGGVAKGTLMKWSKLAFNWFKLNWNVAFCEKNKRMGGGIVVRSWESDLVAAAGWSKRFITNPLLAEATTLERATYLRIELGLYEAIFEGDALVLINDVKGKIENWSWYGQIVEDLMLFFYHNNNRQLKFIPRIGNNAAHILVKLALGFEEEVVWIEEGPREILQCVDCEKL